ncbi:IclR family transcriptional regulator [Bifidobacterium sp. ESL0704]|uniref:IclR family transcriptional regulator n=1 Tax=Bifidobacterium sp. ESL0704 TaxID=2983219 RepID=UPI0023F68665|nr:IclR family transcriptional regulator [Bifidobacterium sp. ESL0704]WEV52789.1 IclR family transcriptional regulator [Bifidobacterium sp. ESL0704]
MEQQQHHTNVDPGGVKPVKSAARTVLILEYLAKHAESPSTLSELSAAIKAPRSSTYALLRTLIDYGWIRSDHPGNLYRLNLRTLLVGESYLDADPYVRIVRPVLADLSRKVTGTFNMSRMDDNRMVYLLTQESRRDSTLLPRIGRWLPTYATGSGKALLAIRGKADIPAKRPPITSKTITDLKELMADLNATRQRGYGLEVDENNLGYSCVAVVLRYQSPPQDAISCTLKTRDFTEKRRRTIIDALMEARDKIEKAAPLPGTWY